MRKLKEPERNCNVITKKVNSTTCGNDFVSMVNFFVFQLFNPTNNLILATRNPRTNIGSTQ